VYPENRTWHNWLLFEWKYRNLLQEIFPIEHAFDYEIENPTDKHLFLSVTPKLAYYSYLKFNSNLNNCSPSLFQEMTNRWIQKTKLYCLKYPDHCLNLNGDILFNSVLDYDFYQTVTKFFNLDLKYDLANQIHNRWYHLHKKAEQELIIDLQNIYSKHTG
jgi:hypothetical protein